MAGDRVVMCIKWGKVFGPDYVNVLHRACRAHITGPFKFVCLTPDGAGLDPDIVVHPIPDVGLSPEQWYTPGVWPKLAIFSETLADLGARCLFIDLDMMITGSLDPMFDAQGGFIALDGGENWYPGRSGHAPMTATGVFAFDLGQQAQIKQAFDADKAAAIAKYPTEQDFVSDHARDISYWPTGMVISFKRWLRRPLGLDLFLAPPPPDPGTNILAFHGTPRPIDMIGKRAGFWDSFPHLGNGEVAWVRDYWVKYGGAMPSKEG